MKNQPTRYTVTAALPYANGPVHIGHLAGCYLPADIYVRYLRSKGRDVLFICGSDEHGVPITIKAKNEGITPQQVVDKYHTIMGDAFKGFGVSFDVYSRTSKEIHHETSSDFFKNLYQKGIFEEKISKQYYDEDFKMFLTDRNIVGTCPKCSNENAYGDQCERCGTSLDPMDLINPVSKLSGKKPIVKDTKHWYLPLNKSQEQWLEGWVDKHDPQNTSEGYERWKTNVFGQCKSWLTQGLQPRAVTRDLDWGVPVPLEEAKGKVLYVWFDAPIGYISATKDYFAQWPSPNPSQKEGNTRSENASSQLIGAAFSPNGGSRGGSWEDYWKKDDTKLVHFIGKDNIVFHCIVFPAMLKAHGDYILPENVPANEFLNLEGDKISTSRNWAVWLHEYLLEFPNKQDVLRYTLCANAPETKDNDFTWKDFQARNNNELVAILGNFVNRTLVLTHKYYNGVVPTPNTYTEYDQQVITELKSTPTRIADSIEQYRFREALSELMNLARLGNKYLADTEPWKLIKDDESRVQTIMYLGLQITAALTTLCEPFMPFSAQRLREMLNMKQFSWDDAGSETILASGHTIGQASLLFEKIEDATIEAQVNKLLETKKHNELANAKPIEAKPETTFDDFSKMDMRIGTITAAEKVPKTQKLLKLTIDTGIDQRTVVSGIAEYYEPEKIIGQQVTILVNLAPRAIKGIESQGMILMAENASGELAFVTPSKEFTNGSTVR